jgi:hypothetical protein
MTQELSTTSILSLFETSKEQRQTFALGVVNALQEGQADPLKIHLQVKCMEDIIKLLNGNTVYKSAVLDAAGTYGQKSFDFQNSKVEIKETGVKYDFSKCEDLALIELHRQQAELDAKVKARETMLKTIPLKGMIITDEETGDTYTVYPPSKSSTTSVAITLK